MKITCEVCASDFTANKAEAVCPFCGSVNRVAEQNQNTTAPPSHAAQGNVNMQSEEGTAVTVVKKDKAMWQVTLAICALGIAFIILGGAVSRVIEAVGYKESTVLAVNDTEVQIGEGFNYNGTNITVTGAKQVAVPEKMFKLPTDTKLYCVAVAVEVSGDYIYDGRDGEIYLGYGDNKYCGEVKYYDAEKYALALGITPIDIKGYGSGVRAGNILFFVPQEITQGDIYFGEMTKKTVGYSADKTYKVKLSIESEAE